METALVLAICWYAYWLFDLILNGRWWLWEFTSMVPGFCWILVWLAISAVSISSQSLLALVINILTLPMVYRSVDIHFSPASKRESHSNMFPIKLFNWNTLHWTEPSKPGFYDYLRAQDADVYHLQEAIDPQGEVIEVVSELQQHFPDYQVLQSGELVTMTRLPIVNSFINPSLPFLRVDLEIEGKSISFYNVHITVHIAPDHLRQSISLFFRKIYQRFKLRKQEYSNLWQELEANQLPKVISGDFNTAKSQTAIRRFLRKYQDSFRELHWGIPATYAFAKKLRLWRIDYVFASQELIFIKNDYVEPHQLSDHVGSSVYMRFR